MFRIFPGKFLKIFMIFKKTAAFELVQSISDILGSKLTTTVSLYFSKRKPFLSYEKNTFLPKMLFSLPIFSSFCNFPLSYAKIKWFCVSEPCTRLLTHLVRPIFDQISAWSFLCVIRKFLPANIFGNFLFDSPSFINTDFKIINS